MIFIVSTEPAEGKGGISSAVESLKDVHLLSMQGASFVTSHAAGKRFLSFNAFLYLLRQVQKNDLAWFHCGRWLSILRKMCVSVAAKVRGAKVIMHFHSVALEDYLASYLGRAFIRFVVWWADTVFVVTPYWQAKLAEVFPSFSDKLHVCPNAIPDAFAQQGKQHAQNNTPLLHTEKIRLLSMSRLVEGKGFEEAICALSVLPDTYQLTIAGDGPLLAHLKTLVETKGLASRVSFSGWLDREQKIKALKSHDVFILPSQYDSFGMVFIEAMAFGLPVVALDVRGLDYVVPNDKAGCLCENTRPQVLADAVKQCVKNSEVYGRAGVAHVEDRFNKESAVSNALSSAKYM